MSQDRQQVSAFRNDRRHARKEWEPAREQQHPMESREAAPHGGRAQRAYATRTAEAERQIRELASRY